MIISFNIHYKTQIGEYLGVEYIENDENQYVNCQTLNGENWNGLLEWSKNKSLKYRYFLGLADGSRKYEWGELRFIESFDADKTAYILDNWRPRTNESNSFFSAAFSKAVLWRNKRQKSPLKKSRKKSNFVHFKMAMPAIRPDESIAILGSCDALGKWIEPQIMSDEHYPIWEFQIPWNQELIDLEYKYAIVDTSSGNIKSWESGDNRSVKATLPSPHGSAFYRRDEEFRYEHEKWRGAGVAIPVFSLRSSRSMGIGEFSDLKPLIDWSASLGMNVVQVLPVNDTIASKTWVDSYPYAAISVFALHPLYINIDEIADFKTAKDKRAYNKSRTELNLLADLDFDRVLKDKFEYFRILYKQEIAATEGASEFQAFVEKNRDWLLPYAAFCYFRDANGTPNFNEWESHQTFDQKKIEILFSEDRKAKEEMLFYIFLQYHAHRQLTAARDYGRTKRVALKGDLPIGIYRYSADAWVAPELYNMEEQAGAPPDDYSVLGQNWGFPTYNWEVMEQNGFEWWRKRMQKLSEYFDALRIDHILGFFRIYQIPVNQIYGTLGLFNPRLPMSREEIARTGIKGRLDRYTMPYITTDMLNDYFGEESLKIAEMFLVKMPHERYVFKTEYPDQRTLKAKIDELGWGQYEHGILSLMTEVMLIEEPGSNGDLFNPRITVSTTRSFQDLGDFEKSMVHYLYNDYYFHRHEDFWRLQAMKRLPALLDATDMLICGEDLGMIPASVAGVMRELNIMSLEIQRMPKGQGRFGHVPTYPYFSVCSPSCHDMSTIRGWWESDYAIAQDFFNNYFKLPGEAPGECVTEIVQSIVEDHLSSPSMLAIFPIQDLVGMDSSLRREVASEEQINDPSNSRHYWKYRFHINIEELATARNLNEKIEGFLLKHRRK
jgi:4-alpha-glucanotransferase